MKRKSKVVKPVNKYDAAGMGRRMKSWNPPSTGPNKAITGLQTIRNRARDSARNDWSGESAISHWTTNLIGVGIVPRFREIEDFERRKVIIKEFAKWVRKADADGVLNYYGMQTLGVRSWLDAGEVFIRKRPRKLDFGLNVPLQMQMIEADYVPMLDADTWPFLPTGNRIRSGIELDRSGQRVAYWVYKDHPGDKPTTPNASDLLRIDASEMIHLFEPKRPGQLRGVSMLAPILARLRSTTDFEDTVLERQKIANLFTVFITRNAGGADDIDPLSGQPLEYDQMGQPMVSLAPGLSQELAPGEDVKFANPPEAGTTFSDYMRTTQLGTAAGTGLPYELMSGDIMNVSDRTLRVVINEFRRFAEQRQWQIIIPKLCEVPMEWWADAAVLGGVITLDERDAVAMAEWSPHGWPYIHPVQDAQGKKIEVDAGFRSRSSVIAERGDDPELVDDERHDDKEREDVLGIAPVVPGAVPLDPNAPDAPPDGNPADPNEPKPNDPQPTNVVPIGVRREVIRDSSGFIKGFNEIPIYKE